jgi:hypothetical protein
MGISLWDIGAVATGAIERDRELTKENLAIRADELTAKRNSLISRKNKKYDTELALYVKEQEKVNKVKALNATTMHDDNPLAWATRYLTATDSDFVKLSDTMQEDIAGAFAQSNAGKKLSELAYPNVATDPDKLAAILAAEEDSIYKNTREQLLNAKGDSFLIKKILGDSYKKSETQDLEKLVAADDKVKKVIADTDKKEITEATTEDKILGEFTYTKKMKPKYLARFEKLDDAIVYKSATQNNNFLEWMGQNDILGIATEANFELTESDTKIDGLTDGARQFLITYKDLYDDVKKNISAETLLKSGVKQSELGDHVSVAAVNEKVQNIIEQRFYKERFGAAGGTYGADPRDFVGVVPLSIVDEDGIITFKGDKRRTVTNWDAMKNSYKLFIDTKAAELIETGRFKKVAEGEFNARNAVQKSIQNGGLYATEFIDWYAKEAGIQATVTDPDKPIESQTKVMADVKAGTEDLWAKKPPLIRDSVTEPASGSKYSGKNKIVIMTEGRGGNKKDTGFKQFNSKTKQVEKYTWQKIKDSNQVDLLPPYLRVKYDNWLATQGG